MNLAEIVRRNARRHPHKAAIDFHTQTIDYKELWRNIEGVASFLTEAGAQQGSRIGLALADHPLHVIAHYAVAHIGAVILPVDHRWTASEKREAAQAFDAQLVLTDGDDIDGIRTVTLNAAAADHIDPKLKPMDESACDLLISLSSGTTGKPKGALLTHENFLARFEAQWQAIGYGEEDCFALLTPLFFGAGRSFAMSILAAGGTLKLAPPPMKPPQILETLSDAAITATFLPPTLLRRLLPLYQDGAEPLLANLNYLIVSGEPLHADEARDCLRKLCPKLYSYYASSEGGGISLLRADDFDEFAATVGTPMPNTRVQIVDKEGLELSVGQVGRLRYKGPCVADRYIDTDGTEHAGNEDGWFYPGDLAEILPGGHIALRGRDKDVIIRGGVNIYPAEIEAKLLQHDEIMEAAVVGRTDAERGQLVIGFVVSTSLHDSTAVMEWCRKHMAPYKVPTEIRIAADLPRRSSGKIDKKALSTEID